MPFNFNVNLPGPFSYSARIPSPTRELGEVARTLAADDAAVRAQRDQAAQLGGTLVDRPNWAARVLCGLVLVALIALAVAGYAGFRV